MKKCCSCKVEKEVSEFNKNKSKSDGLNTICRSCSQDRSKKYYSENTEKHKKVILAKNKKVKEDLRKEILAYKESKGCKYCPESDGVCLDFHHVDSTQKENNIATLVSYGRVKKAREEMLKCVVVCANCHRKLHAGKI